MSEVKLTGRAELDAIYKALQKVGSEAEDAMGATEAMGKKTQENLERTAKKTESGIKKIGGVLRNLAGRLYSDFKGLISLESALAGLKLSNQFRQSLTESVKLNDSVRRLGSSFGVAKADFGYFQAAMARGLGDIGASSEAASNALEGLAGFGVEGIESAMSLTKGAATLAGIGGEKGNEKGIASGLASALQSEGKDVNDVKAQKALIGEVTAAVTATGKSASEILGAMNDIFSKMPDDMRKAFGPEAMAQMATLATAAGPQATGALAEFMQKGKTNRTALEAQGFGKVFNNQGGVDIKELMRFIKEGGKRIPGDKRASLQTFGFSPEMADGLIRIGERADNVATSLSKLETATRDNETAFKDSMGVVDAFKANVNTIKGYIGEGLMGVQEKVTDVLASGIGHPGQSGAVVATGAIAAAALAGGGLRGLLKFGAGAVKGELQSKATEAITGEHVQLVRVMNFSEMPSSGLGAGATAAGGLAGKVGGAIKLAAAADVGYQVGDKIVNPLLDKYTQGETGGIKGNVVERGFAKLDQMLDFTGTQKFHKVDVHVHTKEPNLRTRTAPGRGSSN